jgi:uncharacterized membrane protein
MIKKTIEDGWRCVPELTHVVNKLQCIDSFVYEIKNGNRSSDLDEMVFEMKKYLQGAIDKLNEIDTDVEFETEPSPNNEATEYLKYM